MAGFFVHPGAVVPYERLASAPSGPGMVGEAGRVGEPGQSPAARFYGRLAGRAGRVLEYGAGQGALTWPMARAGAQVTATDLSAPLLSALQQAGAQLEGSVRRRVRTRAGDMRSLRLRQRFPLVVAPSSTFLHLYNRRDVEAFLAGVLHHLTADGVFVFDVALPRAEELVNGYDPVAQIRTIPWVGDVLLAQRQYFPRELQMLLEYNGLTKVRVRGDFGRGTPTADTKVLVFTARAAAGRSRKPRTLRTAKATSQATRSGGRGC